MFAVYAPCPDEMVRLCFSLGPPKIFGVTAVIAVLCVE